MDQYWATRTGRWRRAMQQQLAPSFGARLFEVIRKDILAGTLPVGAHLPTVERVATELVVNATDVRAAYARLLAEGLIAERGEGVLCIAPRTDDDQEATVGDATQIRFEAALLKAVREAAARGLSSDDATGLFKAALQRMHESKLKPDDEPDQ